MNFGLVLQTDAPARRVVELAQRAEANGFTHIWAALRYIGRKPRSLKEMAEAMRVKLLVAGEVVDYDGTQIRFPWVDGGWELPMWGAGY